MISLALAGLAFAIWLYLLFGHGGFWLCDERDDGTPARPAVLPKVVAVVPARVVSRIRIPPEQVFELAKALTQQLEFWEQETGKRSPS